MRLAGRFSRLFYASIAKYFYNAIGQYTTH